MNIKGTMKEVTIDTIEINGFVIFEPGGDYLVYIKEELASNYKGIVECEDIFEDIFEAIMYCIDTGEPYKDLTDCHLISIKSKDLLEVNGFYIVETTNKEYHVYSKENYNLEWFDKYDKFNYPVEAIYFCVTGEKVSQNG